MTSTTARTRYRVDNSPIHGRGVFATGDLPADEPVLDYGGRVITWDEANTRYFDRTSGEDGSTYYFDLGDGTVIDGADDGNEARFLNHSCRPNCAAEIDDGAVHISTARDIHAGEELTLDYALAVDDPDDIEVRALYDCRCGADGCRGTMLGAPADETA